MNNSETSGRFWLRNSDNHPVTLIAWRLEGKYVRYSTATHNPPDEFNRVHAHNKACGRLNSKNPCLSSIVELRHALGIEGTIVYHIIETKRGDKSLPPPRIHDAAVACAGKLVARARKNADLTASA